MSMILVIGNESTIVGYSDGRVSATDEIGDHVVLRENQCKIDRLSDDTMILFAGELSQCLSLVEYLKTLPVENKTPALYSHIIMQTKIVTRKDAPNINVKLIVAGKRADGTREWWSHKISAAGDQCHQTRMTNHMQYLALGDIELDEENYIQEILNQKSVIDKQSIQACFEEASKRHKSINTTLFWQSI